METYNKKYKIVAPDGYVEEWSQADFEKGGAALMSDNPDVKVYSQESYDPTQQYGTNVAYGIEDEDGYFESWTADEWSKGKDALLKDHPNLKIYVLGDASQDYHRQKAEEQRQAITDFDAANKDFIRAHELDSLIMSEGGAVSADYDANDKKYNDLLAEREQLVSNYATNPANKQDWSASAQYADQIASNYESKLKGMRDATRFSNAATSMYSGNIREKNDYVLYEQARKLAKDAAKAYAAPSYGEHTGFGGYVKDMGTGAGKVFSDVDFWSRGLSAIDRDKNVRKIVNSLSEKGINVLEATEKELYDNLSPAQIALISSFLLDAQAQYERSLDTARGYNAGVTFAESIGYMAEFLATGGIARAVGSAGKAASSGFGKLLANELSKGSEAAIKSKVSRGLINTFTKGGTKSLSKSAKAATNIASKAAGKAYSYGIRPAGSAIWHTALQPSTYRTISENLTQINDNGDLVKAGSAIWGGVLDQLIENWSESMGGAVEDILGLPLKGVGAAGEKILGKTTLGQWGKWLADSASAKVLHEAGFNGLIGEMGEEWLGNAARVGLGLMTKDEFKDFASFESQVDMAASFAPMTLFGLGTSSYAAAKQDKNYRKLAKDMRGVLNRAGWSEEDVADVMDVKDTKEWIARTLAPVLQSIVRNSQDGKVAQEDYITTLKFAQAAAIQEVLSSAQTIEQERARKDMQEEIAQDLGAVPQEFKNEDGTTVIYPTDNRGNFSYTQVAQTPSGNYGVNVVTTAKDAKGEYFVIPDDDSDTMLLKNRNDANATPRFISRQEFQEQVDAGLMTTETSTLENYLDARIEEKREMQRKYAENAQLEDKYQQVAQKMQVGSKINAGTEDAPMEGIVLAVDRGGVTVDFGQPVLLNGRNMQIHKLSLEQAGNFVGVDARIESEQRSVEEQVEQDEINSAKVKAYNQSLAGEQFTVDGHLYTYVHMFEMPQLDEDGIEIAHIVATDEQGRDVEMDIPLEDIKTRETDAAVKTNEQVEEVKDDNVLRDIHGNPIPMRVNEKTQQEEVDKRTFKNKDPEAYYAWNDAQRGGNTEDSMQAITADIASETAQLTALQKQLTVETDPDMRDELHESVNKTQNRINLLEDIYHKYDAENNFQDEQLDFARRIYDVQSKLINAKTQEQVDALIKIKADLFRHYQLATVDSAENVMLAKRAVELQQVINSVADVPVQVVFESNIESVMRTDGASEASINRVLSKVAELRSARITSGKDLVMTGLYNEGKVYIFAEGNTDASSALLTYYHERQHMRTAEDPEAMNKVLVLARNERDNLMQVLSLLTDNIAPYQGASNQELADEIVASAMEKACTDEKYEQTLRSRGLSEELINIIKTEYAKQRRITDSDAVRQEDWNANVRTSDTGNGQQDGAVEQGASGNGQLGTAQLSTDTGISEEEPQVDTAPRDFRGNPLPLEADGTTVDQKTLWENDPEAWARWNDDINNDAGADSIAYINAVIEKLNKAIKTNEKAYAKATDFDKRDTLKGQIKEEKQRLDELQAILRAYRQKQSEEASAKMQADAVRAREARKAKAEELAKYNTESLQDVKRKWEDAPKDTGDVDSIVLANGERIEGHYVLTEAFAPTPSHDPVAGYSMTKGFPVDENGNTVNDRDYQHDKEAQRLVEQKASSFDQRALQTPVVVSSDGVVLSGNDRTMASQIAARQGTDNNYNTYLASHPQRFGFTADQISNYSNPRVVFVPDAPMPYTAATFAKFNAEEKKTQSKTESAVKAGKTISPEAVEHIAMIVNEHESIAETYSDKNAVAAILRILIDSGVVQESEISRLMDGDSLSGTGEDLVESVILGAVMREDALRCAMGDKMIRRSVMSALTQLLKNNTYGEYSLSGEFSDAVVLLYQAKRSGLVEPGESVANFMNQPVLDGFGENPLAEVTVQMLANTINGTKVNGLKNVLSLYNARAEMAASGQADLFLGSVEAKEQIIREILNEYGYNTETFTAAAEEQRPGQQSEQQSKQGSSEEQAPDAVSGDAGSGAEEVVNPTLLDVVKILYSKGKEYASKIFQRSFLDVTETPKFMRELGLTGEKFTIKYGVISRHLSKDGSHAITEQEWEQLPGALQHPFAISKLTDRSKGYRIYTTLQTGNSEYIVVGVDVKNAGRDIEVNSIATVFGRRENANLSSNEEVIYRSKEITPEQSSLLGQPNSDQYPTNQEFSSGDKFTQSSETKQENHGAEEINQVRAIEEQRKVVDTEPTEAQKEAGNYRMGHVRIDGLDITIENPRGSIRKGTDADGHEWQTEIHNDYGYIRGTKAVDGDHIDVFLSDNPTRGKVYVIDQVDPKTGEFDESKVMYGFDSEQDAREAYLSNYEDGWQGLGKVTEVSKEEFKKWIDSSTRKTKPFSEYASVKAAEDKKENTTDNQGNPVNEDGTLKVEKIKVIDDLKDSDFSKPDRNVALPDLPENVDSAIGAEGKPVIIKKSIFEKVSKAHSFSADESRKILKDALYNPDIVGQSQPKSKKNNWIAIKIDDSSPIVVLEVNRNKDNVEIVGWYTLDARNLERIKRQAEREDGELLILTPKGAAASLSTLPSDLSSDGKDTQSSETKQVSKGESGAPKIKKVNPFDFVDKDKHTQRPIFKGVYHDKGMLVATDAAVLVAIKDNYPEELERAVTFKDGYIAADVKFPDWRSVFTDTGKQTKVDITLDKLASYLEQIKANVPKKILTDEDRRASFVVIDFGDGNSSAYNYERLVKFVNAARFLNAQVSYCSSQGKNSPDKKLIAEGANGMVALFPVKFGEDHKFNYNVPLNEAENTRFRIAELSSEEVSSAASQKDEEYFAALESGDMETAQRIVKEAAERAGYSIDSSYQGTSAFNGAAPWGNGYFQTKEERKDAWDNDEFDGDQTLSDYIERGIDAMNLDYIALDPRSYRFADHERKEAIDNVRNAIQKKSKTITMYRSVPSNVKEGSFRNGDWITPSRAYAVENAKIHGWGDNYNIIEQMVPTDEIWWDGNDIAEWGYGREADYVNDTDFAYKNTENNKKLLDVITRDDDGNIIPPSKRFDSGKADERYRISGRKAIDEKSKESRIAYEAVKEQLDRIGIPVELLSDQAMREMAINANALETVSSQDEYQQTVVSSASGAKVINNLDNLAKSLENESKTKEKTFLGALAKALDAKKHGSNSQYATFEAKNGTVVTIRLANHNVTTSTFDNHGENDGISIVVSARKNNGIINDGKAHVTEFYYDAIKLRKAEGKPLVDIVKSVKQSLYSGEYKDTTGLAQREEVNAKDVPEFMTVYHGSGAKFDKFDHSHMGEGEGAQAYGWGTYVTEVEGIGRTYAKAAAAKDGDLMNRYTSYIRNRMASGISFEAAKKELMERLEKIYEKQTDETLYANFRESFKKLKALTERELPLRELYTVEIPGDINSDPSKDEILKGLDSLGKELFSGYGLNDVQINAVFGTTREWYELGYTATSGFFPLKEVFKAYGIDAETIDKRIHDEAMEDRRKNPAGYGQYLSWEKPLGEDGSNRFEGVISSVFEPLSKGVLKLKTGKNIYNLLSRQYGSAQAASEKLEDLGYIGISYPAQYISGGRPDGARNYVIFNENNAKIVDRIEFLREPDGTVYGATVGGKIYLNRERLNPNTPIHEYTHLWFSALKDANLKLYKRGVELMKQLPIWEEVRTDPNYANLSGDDAIASECLSRLVGDKGADVLTKMAKDANVRGDIIGTANRISLIEKFKDWLKKFWTWVRDSFTPWTKEEAARVSVDDIQNMVLSDLAKGVNPLANAREESEMKKTNDKYNDDDFEYLIKRNPGSFDAPENGIRFRIVTEPKLIEQLNLEPTVKVFRAMQIVDGELFPPMSITVNGKKREPSKIGQWEQSEENPELADEDGYFKLNKGKNDKGENKSLKAKYNPYFHTSLFPLNDQFSEAQTRSNIVIVEGRVPKSELTSGYRAEKAKDSVGKMTWHSGPVAGILGQYEGKEREVILSRWFKPERIVPYDQIADISVQMFKGTSLEKNPLPSNVFHPDLRNELEKRGVSFVETNNRGQLLDDAEGRTWSSLYGKEAAGKKARVEAKEQDVVDMFYDADELSKNDEIFNMELENFKDNKHKGLLHLGKPLGILKASGINAEEMTISPSVLHRHLKKHGLTTDDLKGLARSIQSPILVYKHGKNSPNIVAITELDVKGGKLSASFELDSNGRVVDVSNISSVHSKEAKIELERLYKMGESDFRNALRWVEKGKVLNWLAPSSYKLSGMQAGEAPFDIANIVKSFENPRVSFENIANEGDMLPDDTRFRIVGGNSGYVGYSMSKRAAEAKEEGRFPKTQFVKEYGVPATHLDALVAAGIISNDEWHHTSKFGNKTPFYGWVEDSFLQAYNDNKAAIEEIIKQYNGTDPLSFTERRKLAEKIAAIIESSESVVSSREPAEALIAQRKAEKAHRRDVMSEMANSEGKIKKSGNEYWYNADNQVSLHMHDNGRIIDLEFPIGTKTQSQRDELYKAAQEEFREAYERAEKILQDKANENSEEQKQTPDVESSGSHFRAVKSYDGLQSFGQDKLFDIMHKTFADLPESTRTKITKLAPAHGYKFHEATADYFASLATKKDLSEEEKMDVMVVRDNIKAALDIDYLSCSEALWALYNTVNKNSKDILSIARRTLVADKLGFMPEDRSKRDDVKDGVRFSIRENSHDASAAEIYNKATSYWYNRLRESYVDMNESVNDLVAAIESTTKQPAQAFEDVRLAINRQSSKGLNQMTKFMSDYLEPMWGAVGKVMEATGMTYDEVVRYVMLKHAVERNDVFARRDARRFYERKCDSIISKLKDEKKQKENMRKRAMANAEISIAYALDQEIQNIDKQIDSALKSLDRQLVKVDNGTSTKYKELREQDYGGLTSMYSKYPGLGARSDYATDEEYNKAARKVRVPMYDNVSDMENAARSEVNAFEKRTSGDEFNELWRRINAATKKTLESQYDNNIISREQYNAARDQFKYYVPLRGFKDTEAEDIWTYMDVSLSGSFAPALKNAKGRKSEAENPFNWIGTMASSAIAQNVKNEAKLALYYFIANRPNQDLVTIGKVWYQYDAAATAAHAAANPGDTRKIFTPVYPPVTTGLDSNAAKDAYDTWEADMRAKAAAGEAYLRTNKLNVQDDVAFISDKQVPQHVIKLKVRGEEVNLYINGDPRAAQAINGMLNIETNSGYQKVFGPILRWMSAVNTSYNPEFWISNLQRDFLFALMSSTITGEGANNLLKGFVNPKKIVQMMRDYEAGKLGNSREENYYREFAEGGGITGFTVIVGNEVWEKKIQEYLNPSDFAKISKSIKFDKFLKFFNDLGEAVEQMSRFAAFIGAREAGKSIEEAVAASKEITVNFNRKGSGKAVDWADLDKLTTADGAKLNKAQKLAVFTASFIPAYGRRFIMFFNAAVQGANAMYKLWKKDHRKTLAWASGYFAIGVLQAVLHALADDDDDYLDIPDYTRRSNLLLGGGGIYFKWALPQEMRPFYAWGDIFVNQVMGREPNKNMLLEMANSAADILPLGPGGVLPSVIQPSWDLYTNKDFTGSRIYNDNKYLSDAEREARPNYKDPRPQTNKLFIDISQVLNALSGGDEYSAGAVNVHPESMQHVVESLGGGLLTTMNKTEETVAGTLGAIIGEDMIDQDLSVRRFPFLNRVLMVNDERTRNSHVSDLYYYYKDMSDVVEDKMRRMKKEMNYDALEKLQNSPEYEVYQIVKSYKKMMQRYDDDLKAEEDRNERKNIMREQDELRKEMINEISQTR